MTRRDVGVLPPDRRRALLETAAAEFAEAGYERASLNRIIRAQGMSKSSFYHYFDSKEALFDAVVANLGAALAAALRPPSPEALATGDFWGQIDEVAGRLSGLGQTNPAYRQLAKLFYLADAPAAPGSAIAAARTAVEAWIDRALAVGRERGAVGTDLPVPLQRHLVKAVLWALDEWSIAAADKLSAKEQREIGEAQTAAVRRLLSD